MREITASGLFDNHLRQQSCLSWLSIIPRRLFHDKPGKNPDYSLNNVVGENTVLQLNILKTGVLTLVVQNSSPTRLRLVGDELWTTRVRTPVSKMFRWRTYNSREWTEWYTIRTFVIVLICHIPQCLASLVFTTIRQHIPGSFHNDIPHHEHLLWNFCAKKTIIQMKRIPHPYLWPFILCFSMKNLL